MKAVSVLSIAAGDTIGQILILSVDSEKAVAACRCKECGKDFSRKLDSLAEAKSKDRDSACKKCGTKRRVRFGNRKRV